MQAKGINEGVEWCLYRCWLANGRLAGKAPGFPVQQLTETILFAGIEEESTHILEPFGKKWAMATRIQRGHLAEIRFVRTRRGPSDSLWCFDLLKGRMPNIPVHVG